MTAITYGGRRSGRSTLVVLVSVLLMSLWPLYGMVLRLVPTTHADQRHGGEKYPPSLIRACLARMVLEGETPYQYENTVAGKVAVVCKLDKNRYAVQINRVVRGEGGQVIYEEITVFYQTLSRMRNILERDGYLPVVPLPPQ